MHKEHVLKKPFSLQKQHNVEMLPIVCRFPSHFTHSLNKTFKRMLLYMNRIAHEKAQEAQLLFRYICTFVSYRHMEAPLA